MFGFIAWPLVAKARRLMAKLSIVGIPVHTSFAWEVDGDRGQKKEREVKSKKKNVFG